MLLRSMSVWLHYCTAAAALFLAVRMIRTFGRSFPTTYIVLGTSTLIPYACTCLKSTEN